MYLRRSEARVSEHADLVGDVLPVVLGSQPLQVADQGLTSANDAVGHRLDVLLPLGAKGRVGEDGAHDACAIGRRVAVHGADHLVELRHDRLGLLRVGSDDVQGADTLAVETHVLGVGLRDKHLVALLSEVPERGAVPIDVSAGKALMGQRDGQRTKPNQAATLKPEQAHLISAVEEHYVLPLLTSIRYALPLLERRIHARWVVSTSMKQNDRSLRSGLTRIKQQRNVSEDQQTTRKEEATHSQVLDEALVVEALGVGIVVAVALDLESVELEDGKVVHVGWVGHVNGGALVSRRQESGQELGSNPEGAWSQQEEGSR